MIEKIKEANLENKLVVFIGAGVSVNSGYVSWQDLIREMDQAISYSDNPKEKFYSNDELLRIPQYFEKINETKYKEMLEAKFSWLPKESNPIIDTILELNPHHIITTNFDCLVEYSIRQFENDEIKKRKNNNYAIVRKNKDLVSVDKNNLLIKMHGDWEAFDSLVLKEDDYLKYSISHCLIEIFIKSLLIDHSFIFVGYSISDYNLKLILNWFETTISEYDIDKSKRKSHYFINPSETSMSEFDKDYFEAKNIRIIESLSIPNEYREIEIESITHPKGKNIYRTLQYIKNSEPSKKTINYVFEKLQPFSSCNRIVFQDLIGVLCGYPNPMYKLINDEFHYRSDIIYNKEVEVAIKAIKSKMQTNEERYIRNIFIKAGVNKLVDDSKGIEFIINDKFLVDDLYTAIAEKDFSKMYNFIDDPSINSIISLYLKMFINEKDEVEETLKHLKENFDYNNLIEYIILLQNGLHPMTNELDYPIELIDVLDKYEKKYIATICDLNDGFNSLFSELSSEIVKIQKKYSPYSNKTYSEFGVENANYKDISTRIINIMKYFICNGFYTFGCYSSTTNLSGYIKLLELYVDNLFFFQSPKCNHSRYEYIEITKDDLVIISSYLKAEDILLMLKKYDIKKINLSEECIEYLLCSLKNTIIEIQRRIINGNQGEFYLSQVALTICELLNICMLSNKNEDYFVEIACILLSITSLDMSEYNYVVIRELYSRLLELIFKYSWNNSSEKKIHCLKNTLLSILQSFNSENHYEQYSVVYERFIEPYRIVLNITSILSNNNIVLENSIIDEFISNCLTVKSYRDALIDIYPVSTEDKKLLIEQAIRSDFKNFSGFYIYIALERKIIIYDEALEMHLVKMCEDHVERQKIDDSGFWNSPLYVILRLKEKGIIKDLKNYEKFASKNYFFNFVCFPNEFDYNNFNVMWYSWLDLPEYSQAAIKNAKSILKRKYEEAINSGTIENIKATYYRFFYEADLEANK